MPSSINELRNVTPAETAQPVSSSAVSEASKKVRLGGMSPCFVAASIADSGKVRLGGMSPNF